MMVNRNCLWHDLLLRYVDCSVLWCYAVLKCQLSGDAPQRSWSSIDDVHYSGSVCWLSKSYIRYTSRLRDATRGTLYLNINPTLCFMTYLDTVGSGACRKALSRFRLSSKHLKVESSRWHNPQPIPFNDRKCTLWRTSSILYVNVQNMNKYEEFIYRTILYHTVVCTRLLNLYARMTLPCFKILHFL